MDEIKEEDNYSILTDYDDGVVCFGKETESQRERRKRLPRHTVLPSDIQLINKSLVNSYKNDEDYENDQSTSIMDNSGKSTSMPIDDPINDVTETTNFLENKEATRTIQLKQSSPNNSSYETFSDQNKSVFAEDETVSYIDVQEAELSTNNCVYSETSSSKSSVSSVIEKSVINNHKIPDRDDNICTLKHCSQQEDEDISYCCDSELEDNDEYSIVADKYSITPGKQRLFDSRHAKLSIRAKTIVTSAPFMDKIEETTTPLLKTPSSSPMLINDVSYEPLENEDGVYRTSVTSLDQKSSAVNFNQTSCVWDLKSKKSIDENMGESSKSTNCNYSVSKRVSKPSIVDMESSLFDTTIEETCENKLQNNFPPTNIETKIDFNMPLKVVNETLNTSNISEHIFDADKSINNMSNVEFPMAAINNFNNETTSEVVLAEIKNSVGNDTMSTNILNTNGKDKNLKKSFDETSQTKNILNVTKLNFDIRKSTTSMSNIVVRTADINGYNEEESELMEVDIKSTNTSIVDTIFDETMCTSMLSLNDKSKHFDNSSNEISQDKYISKVAEKSFGNEKSMNVMSNINVSAADINDYNYEVKSVVEDADIKSSNSSIVDKIFDETMCTSMLSSNNKSKHLDNSSNEISQAEDTSNVAEKSFDNEKSMNIMPNKIAVPAADVNDYNNEEKSEPMEVDIKSTDTSIVDKIFDETMCTSMLSLNDKSKHFDNPSNEISQNKDNSNFVKLSINYEKSIIIMPNIIFPIADVNDSNNEEKSIVEEANVISSNSSIVDKIFDETMHTSILATYNIYDDSNKSSNEISQAKDTLKVAEHSFDVGKSLDNTDVLSSNIKESILLSKSRDNILKYSENIEIPCSEKMDLVFSNEISKTNDNTSEDISRGMRQYLEFEQNIYDKCNDILSENCDTNVDNKSNTYSDQTLDNISMIEQILCSDSFISMKDNDNLSSSDNSLRPQLSVIIENRTLEENYCDMEQNENFEDPINDLSTTSVSKCNINEIQDDEKLNKSTNPNKMEYIFSKDVSKSELNQTDNKFEIKNKSNKGIFIINNIDSELILNENNKATYDTISDDKMDKTEPNKNLMLNDELSKTEPHILAEMENFLNNKSIEHCLVSKDVKEMCLNQNTLNKNDLTQILIQENMTNNHDFTTIECTQESENIYKNSFDSKQEAFSNNDFQQHNLLSTDKNIHDNSLDEFNKLEHMCNFEEDKKLQTFDYMTPKIQKLLDFSIMQQSPNYVNQIKNQKLLNFSIVDQTPLRKSIQPTNLDEKIIGKKNTLIDFSAVDQMWDLDVASPNKMISKNDLLNSSKDSLLENLSAISAPDFELLADKSILTNSSNHNNLSLNQTITDTNLNLSTNLGKINESKNNIDKKNTEEPNVKSSDKENLNCSMLLNNEQINSNEPTSSLDKTIEQIDLELNYTNKSCNKLCLDEITGAKYQSTCLSNTSLNQSFKNPDSTDFIMDSNQQSIFNSNLCAIKDFSIIEEQSLQIPKLKDNTNSLVVGSDLNVSNLIEMSAVSKIDIKSNDQALVSSDNPVIVVTSEKSINSSSSENNTAIHFEEHIFSHNHEFLTDIQMNDVSLIESSEKSSVGESFHSIESDQLQEDNKRKTEPDQEHHNHEKKMKVATEEPRTPMSMLYKLRNMFKSSEKPPIIKSNTNENDLKSDKCYQKLNLSNVEENKNKSICYKKPEVLIKSKIPCKVSDKSMLKNCDFNNSSLSLNESIKPKKAIPRFIGTPVLSDVSNSSNRKCPESRIPSKFKK